MNDIAFTEEAKGRESRAPGLTAEFEKAGFSFNAGASEREKAT